MTTESEKSRTEFTALSRQPFTVRYPERTPKQIRDSGRSQWEARNGVEWVRNAHVDGGLRVVSCGVMTSLSAVYIDPIGSQGSLYYALKRGLDIILVLCLGILSLPLIVIVAIAIRLESTGPILFRQIRVGSRRVRTTAGFKWELHPFSMLKFRTMEHNADPTVHREYMSAYIRGDDDDLRRASMLTTEGTYKMVKDPRVTRVGRVIRALSIDELPQLWNVVRGEMSLVGPRPPIDYEVELYDQRHLLRFAATQGLTGWWQVSGRATTDFENMVDIDLDYIERQSLLLDLRILALTVPAVLLRNGAG